jgi:hypothetical protein
MSSRGLIEYSDAGQEVRAVFDDIKRTRKIEDVNNFWKCLARDPATLKRWGAKPTLGGHHRNDADDSHRKPLLGRAASRR